MPPAPTAPKPDLDRVDGAIGEIDAFRWLPAADVFRARFLTETPIEMDPDLGDLCSLLRSFLREITLAFLPRVRVTDGRR